MARIRSIKPEFPQSESMGRVSRESRLCFLLLWTVADDSGRCRANSRMLASLLYPYDDDAPQLIDGWLIELEREHCIRRYVIDGDHYLEICNWLKHQKIDHPSPSKIPEFREDSRGLEKDSEKLAPDLDLDLNQGSGSKTPLSGKPDLIPDCESVISYLNKATGRNFRVRNPAGGITATAKAVIARLREGYTAQQIREVVFAKCEEWKGNPQMDEFLRPKTLFGRINFENYSGVLNGMPEVQQ